MLEFWRKKSLETWRNQILRQQIKREGGSQPWERRGSQPGLFKRCWCLQKLQAMGGSALALPICIPKGNELKFPLGHPRFPVSFPFQPSPGMMRTLGPPALGWGSLGRDGRAQRDFYPHWPQTQGKSVPSALCSHPENWDILRLNEFLEPSEEVFWDNDAPGCIYVTGLNSRGFRASPAWSRALCSKFHECNLSSGCGEKRISPSQQLNPPSGEKTTSSLLSQMELSWEPHLTQAFTLFQFKHRKKLCIQRGIYTVFIFRLNLMQKLELKKKSSKGKVKMNFWLVAGPAAPLNKIWGDQYVDRIFCGINTLRGKWGKDGWGAFQAFGSALQN